MKRLLFVSLLIMTIKLSFGQAGEIYELELPVNEQGLIDYTDVIQVEDVTKDELYSRAREWFVTCYNSAEDVLQMDDKESGKLIGKAFKDIIIQSMGIPVKIKMYYTISIYLKDGRYKYSISDIEYQGYADANIPNPPRVPAEGTIIHMLYKKSGKPRAINKQYKEETIVSMNALILDLKQNMTESDLLNEEDDW